MSHGRALGREGDQLLVSHLGDLEHLSVSVGGDELLDDHESSSDSDNQLSVEDLGVNLLGSEQVEPIADLADWYWAVSLVDIMGQHLIYQVSLGHREHGLVLLLADTSVHDLNDLILVLDE